MPAPTENRIVRAEPDARTCTVRLTWANGAMTVNRFGHLVGDGVFAPLRDPAVFALVRVGDRGRSLEWPGDIDFCADALWFETHPEDNPFAESATRPLVAPSHVSP
ncbi:MAG: DUF2442 domain-containing protein [Alphaproteobacteria bacterium]|nr:DUF2442 domain-containing protein [Alphaproteobacteria bacterium]